MSDLAERLRHPDCVDANCVKCRAADRIEALEAQFKYFGELADQHRKELEARIEELEKALAIFMQFEGRDEEYTWVDQALFREARAALNHSSQKPPISK